jgi:hypothetical protein
MRLGAATTVSAAIANRAEKTRCRVVDIVILSGDHLSGTNTWQSHFAHRISFGSLLQLLFFSAAYHRKSYAADGVVMDRSSRHT